MSVSVRASQSSSYMIEPNTMDDIGCLCESEAITTTRDGTVLGR